MSFTKVSSYLYLSLFWILKTAKGDDQISYFCAEQTNSLDRITNYEMVIAHLYFNTPPTGFAGAAFGDNPDHADGFALCPGYVSSQNCQACVAGASYQIRQTCPNSKAAYVLYEKCFLLYTDSRPWGVCDNSMIGCVQSGDQASVPPTFEQTVSALLSQLANQASGTPNMWAVGSVNIDPTNQVYGYVQCTRDISMQGVKSCLDGMIGQLPNSCTKGRIGARFFSGTCFIRYDLYQFW